jgi:hypothetical protein
MAFTAAEKQICAEREVRMRKRVYRSRVASGTMNQLDADYEIELMQEIADDYAKLLDAELLI